MLRNVIFVLYDRGRQSYHVQTQYHDPHVSFYVSIPVRVVIHLVSCFINLLVRFHCELQLNGKFA